MGLCPYVCGIPMYAKFFESICSVCDYPKNSWINRTSWKGVILETYTKILKSVHLNPNVTLAPGKRALVQFRTQKVDCFLLGNSEAFRMSYPTFVNIIYSKPFFTAKMKAHILKGDPLITSKEQLSDKVVGVPQENLAIMDDIPTSLTYPVVTEEQGLKMLAKRRLDVMVSTHVNPSKIMKKVHADHNFSIYQFHESLNCHNTTKNQDFINKIDQGLQKMKDNGTYQKILTKYFPELN